MKNAGSLANTFGKNASNCLGLQHSALDLSKEMHDFALWLNSDQFTNQKKRSEDQIVDASPPLNIKHPVAFHDYTEENGMGYGLRAVDQIPAKEDVIKIKTSLALATDSLVDSSSKEYYSDLILKGKPEEEVMHLEKEDSAMVGELWEHSWKVAKKFSNEPRYQNRFFHHSICVQKLLIAMRKDVKDSNPETLMGRSWINALPIEDLSSIVYWDQKSLNTIDSHLLRQQWEGIIQQNYGYYSELIHGEGSPYAKYAKQLSKDDDPKYGQQIGFDQYHWAHNIVSSRNLVLNNQAYQDMSDENAIFMILPLFDFVNHSQEPNCVFNGFHHKLEDESYVVLQTLREIRKGEQLTINYGNLPNHHLIQKYGFTIRDNPRKKVLASIPFRQLEAFGYEELALKNEIAEKLDLAFNPTRLLQSNFFSNKFSQDVLRTLRLSFLTSKQLMDLGGASFAQNNDFKKPIEPENERMVFDFLTQSLEEFRGHLKSREHYAQSADSLSSKINSIHDYNAYNIQVLQMDEQEVLTKNIEYLAKTKKRHLESFL